MFAPPVWRQRSDAAVLYYPPARWKETFHSSSNNWGLLRSLIPAESEMNSAENAASRLYA